MPVASSQGSTVSFAGVPLGSLVTIQASGPSASTADITSMESSLVDGLVLRELDVLSLEPASVVVTFLGLPGATASGSKGELLVDIGGETVISGEAILSRYEIEAAVGDVVRATATFQLTGSQGS